MTMVAWLLEFNSHADQNQYLSYCTICVGIDTGIFHVTQPSLKLVQASLCVQE